MVYTQKNEKNMHLSPHESNILFCTLCKSNGSIASYYQLNIIPICV